MRTKSESWLAWISLAVGVLNFGGETFALVMSSSFYVTEIPALVLSYLSAIALVLAGLRSLQIKPNSGAGVIAGAWGLFFGSYCAHTIAQLERWWPAEAALRGEPPPGLVIANLPLVFLAGLFFVWALLLAVRQTTKRSEG